MSEWTHPLTALCLLSEGRSLFSQRIAKEREPGTLRFDFYQDPKDQNAFFVYEAYRDQKAFEEHKKNEPYQYWESHVMPEMVTRFESFF